MICHSHVSLLQAGVHLRILTHLYTNHNDIESHTEPAFSHVNKMECWCYPPDFISVNEYTFSVIIIINVIIIVIIIICPQ